MSGRETRAVSSSDSNTSNQDILREIRKSHDSLKKSMDNKFDKLNKTIDEKMTSLRNEFTAEIGTVKAELAITDDRLAKVEKKLDSQEASAVETSIVIKGLQDTDAESDENLKDKIDNLMSKISVEVNIAQTTRKGSFVNNKNRLVIVRLQTEGDVDTVIQNKAKLREVDGFKDVYIERLKTQNQLRMESALRTVARGVPNLRFSRGRLLYNDPDNINRNGNGSR